MRAGNWTCNYCGKPTEEKDRVCVVCRTDSTVVKGMVDRKRIRDGGA